MHMDEALYYLIQRGGSDLHLKAGLPVMIRQMGEVIPADSTPLSEDDVKAMVTSILTDKQIQKLYEEWELDFSYNIEELSRFRGNIFFQKGKMGAVFRAIPEEIPSLDKLKMPAILKDLIMKEQGLLLVTGPTGSGKSTTIAAMLNEINLVRRKHIITIEDPIEFVHKDKYCLFNQREVGSDTKSFSEALRRALRQDPDVIVVGEMRDAETITIAMTAAETGHLVVSTLHTNDAKQSIDRIINSFPPEEQHQLRMKLSLCLIGVVSQRLVARADGRGRIAAQEILINSPTIAKLIEDGNIGKIDKTLEESGDYYNMQSLNQALFNLWEQKLINEKDALSISNNANDLNVRFKTAQYAAKGTAQPGSKVPGKPVQGMARPSIGGVLPPNARK